MREEGGAYAQGKAIFSRGAVAAGRRRDADLRAIYRYVRHLGAKGQPAPAYVPQGEKVTPPYFDFTPKNLPPGR